MSDEPSWYLQKRMCKVMNILLQAKWQAGSRNEAGIRELPVPMPFLQILSHKDEVWEQQHNKKNAADDHQMLCTHSDGILDASLQAIWLSSGLKYLRVCLRCLETKRYSKSSAMHLADHTEQGSVAQQGRGGAVRHPPAKPDDGQ